jgi:hypothetical protein
MHACDSSMNLARASPPAFVLNTRLGDSIGIAGQRWWERASWKRGQWKMMCVGVCSGSWPYQQLCGSSARGQWQALYSPVKACSVRSCIAVQKSGRGKVEIPQMKLGGEPEGGWQRAQYTGLIRRLACQISSQSDSASRRTKSWRDSVVGAVMIRSGGTQAAASIAIAWRHFSGLKEAVPGIQQIDRFVVWCVSRMSAAISQMALHTSALSCLSVIWQ